MIFEPDFIDFIELLNKHKVEYMVVGARALAFHGRPRHTGDLDIWIKPSNDNALKVVHTINDFGFGSLGLTTKDFIENKKASGRHKDLGDIELLKKTQRNK